MAKKNVGPSDFAAEIERLKAAGKLPTLEEVLDAVGDARQKFAAKILKVRRVGRVTDRLYGATQQIDAPER